MSWSDNDDYDAGYDGFKGRSPRDGRTIKSSKLPRAVKELEKDDPIDEQDLLDSPESGAHKSFHGTQAAPCMFSPSGTVASEWLPASAKLNQLGVHVTFKVHGGLVAKQFTITAKVPGSNVSKLHQSKLQFFLGQRGHIENFTVRKNTVNHDDSRPPTTQYIVTWTTVGAYGTGLEAAEDYDKESIATFKYMKSLTHGVLTKRTNITLAVADVPGLFNELQAIEAECIKYKIPWFPYLDSAGKPACNWAAFPKRIKVKADSGGLVPVPAQNSFTTITEAHLVLANGICLEYRVSPQTDSTAAWPNTYEDQTYLKTQLSALRTMACGEASAKWWPVILNQSLASFSISDPLGSTKASQSSISDVWKDIENVFPWDSDQKEALRSSRKLRGCVSIVEGGPGSGKTTMLAGIAAAYACSGCPVLLFAPTVPQAKALSQALTKVSDLMQEAARENDSSPWARDLMVVKLFSSEINLENVDDDPEEFIERIEEADIVIALPYAICSQALVGHFGAVSESFVIMHDDAHQLTETEIWGTIFGLYATEKCKGLVMSSDVKEWPLDIATLAPLEKRCRFKWHRHYQQGYQWMFSAYLQHKEKNRKLPGSFRAPSACEFEYSGGVNEFADQTGLDLVSRLLRQGFPSVMLKDQHRLKGALTKIPNELVYKANPLASTPAALYAPDIVRFHTLLRSWLGGSRGAETEGKDMSVVFLEASHGKDICIKERNTTDSKRNHRNVDVVYDLVTRNYRKKALKSEDITIVTQYKDQARLYDLDFGNRMKEDGIPEHSLPNVVTLDTLRGHQAKVIIYDLVVTCGDKSHGLGIINNDFRACLALTRASDILIIVGSYELVTLFPDFWYWMNRRTGLTNNPLPLIVRYAKSLRDNGLSFEPPTEKRKECAFPLKKKWYKDDKRFMPWEWNRNNTTGERE